jgi:hypothetical protein
MFAKARRSAFIHLATCRAFILKWIKIIKIKFGALPAIGLPVLKTIRSGQPVLQVSSMARTASAAS